MAIRAGQSPIVGYIVAGIVIGPFTPGFVGDLETVNALADIGVIFLMFAIGAGIALPELRRVGRVAALGGSTQIVATVAIGYGVGVALGWAPLEALCFGAVISISGSTVLGKILSERGETESEHGLLALAWSAVQDLATIVLVVLLTVLAAGDAGPADLALALGKAALFLVVLLPVGTRLVPRLFEFLASFRSRELFILGVVGLALGTAYLGTFFGISLALGAFVAGLLVGESDLSHQVVGEATPFRDLFAGLFFVSVGMLVDPAYLVANPWPALLALALMVVVKGLIVAGLISLAGYGLRTAVLAGALHAQSAEFSFLLARLGEELGIVTPAVFNMMLTGAVASIVLAPALQRGVRPAVQRIEARIGAEAVHPADSTAPGEGLAGRRIAVIAGYGRVGRVIGTTLERRGIRFVVIEQDARAVREARADGITAVRGSAENQVVLAQVPLAHAAVFVVAIPDPVVVRFVVDSVRRSYPRLPIVVRTHSSAERTVLQRLGATAVIVGEIELGLEMTRSTLRQFGVSSNELNALIAGLRRR